MSDDKRVIEELLMKVRTSYLMYLESNKEAAIENVWSLIIKLVQVTNTFDDCKIKEKIDICFDFAQGRKRLISTLEELVTF